MCLMSGARRWAPGEESGRTGGRDGLVRGEGDGGRTRWADCASGLSFTEICGMWNVECGPSFDIEVHAGRVSHASACKGSPMATSRPVSAGGDGLLERGMATTKREAEQQQTEGWQENGGGRQQQRETGTQRKTGTGESSRHARGNNYNLLRGWTGCARGHGRGRDRGRAAWTEQTLCSSWTCLCLVLGQMAAPVAQQGLAPT